MEQSISSDKDDQGMNWMGCGGEFNLKFSKVCEGWRMIQWQDLWENWIWLGRDQKKLALILVQ